MTLLKTLLLFYLLVLSLSSRRLLYSAKLCSCGVPGTSLSGESKLNKWLRGTWGCRWGKNDICDTGNWLRLQLVGSWMFGVKPSEKWSRVDEQTFSLIQHLSIHIHTSVPASNLWIKTLSVHPQRNPSGPRHGVWDLFKNENCEHWLPPIFAFPRKSWIQA